MEGLSVLDYGADGFDLIDSHAHIHDRLLFDPEPELILKRAKGAGVSQIICIGTDAGDSLAARGFAAQHPGVFWTYGTHPDATAEGWKSFNAKCVEEVPEEIDELMDENTPVAIGEIGLDYHYKPYARERQIELLEKQLELARRHDLPVVFHVREAFPDFLGVVDNFPGIRGVVHSFSDTEESLEESLRRGFYIGVNGLATFAKIPLPPLERMLLETDAPFLTPSGFRGKINESAHVRTIALWLGDKLGVSAMEIAEKTTRNVREFFNLPGTRGERL